MLSLSKCFYIHFHICFAYKPGHTEELQGKLDVDFAFCRQAVDAVRSTWNVRRWQGWYRDEGVLECCWERVKTVKWAAVKNTVPLQATIMHRTISRVIPQAEEQGRSISNKVVVEKEVLNKAKVAKWLLGRLLACILNSHYEKKIALLILWVPWETYEHAVLKKWMEKFCIDLVNVTSKCKHWLFKQKQPDRYGCLWFIITVCVKYIA